jgi:protein-L-isoaspartate(D-aspartate) O-methyltransferase
VSDEFERRRREMVQEQLVERDITDEDVLDAFRTVPREVFVESEYREQAYEDRALPTRSGQTISQPYMVARMTQELGLEEGDRVLEVGTGSGYQSAILAEMGARVYTVEAVSELSERAAERLSSLGYGDRVTFKVGDGTLGWEEHAPYDGIVVTAGAPEVPEPLKQQTAVGGRIVIPVGTKHQQSITIFTRVGESEWDKRESIPCVFVSLVGEEGWSSGK